MLLWRRFIFVSFSGSKTPDAESKKTDEPTPDDPHESDEEKDGKEDEAASKTDEDESEGIVCSV